MSLSNIQIEDLAKRMRIPLEAVVHKDELLFMRPVMNKVYIINLQDEFDENTGKRNPGTHWTCLLTKEDNSGKKYFYFDSYGVVPPNVVQRFVPDDGTIGFNTKDIQGLLSDVCGYFCLALAHYVFSWEHHTGDFYQDINNFLDLFQNMNENYDFYTNETVLKAFFQSSNPNERMPIKNLHAITELSEEQLESLGER